MRRRTFAPRRQAKNYSWTAGDSVAFLPHGFIVPLTIFEGALVGNVNQNETFLLQRIIVDMPYRLGDETLERTSPQLAIQSLGYAVNIIDTDDVTAYDPNDMTAMNFERLLHFGHTEPYGLGSFPVLGTVQDATGGFPYGGRVRFDLKLNRRVTTDMTVIMWVGIDPSISIDVDDDTAVLSFKSRCLFRKI